MQNLWQWGRVIDALLPEEGLARLRSCERLFIGFSGGLDSTVLLYVLSSYPYLKKKLHAIHVNHALSPHALEWQHHCQNVCHEQGIPFFSETIHLHDVGNVEEQARLARYQVFSRFIEEKDALVLAHHQDDQAETMLLHLFRGTGIDGLAGMPLHKTWGKGCLIRPFLMQTRQSILNVANQHGLTWINDESNQNDAFSRNFLRRQILPLLKSRWPQSVANLTRTAAHCRQAQHLLDDLANMDAPSLPSQALDISGFSHLSKARILNSVRAWLKREGARMPSTAISERLVDELILAKEEAEPALRWGPHLLKRYQQKLYLLTHQEQALSPMPWTTFPMPLDLAFGKRLYAQAAKEGLLLPLGSKLDVRYRQGGEVFYWHKQRKSLKKLFQAWQVPPWLRECIPLVFIDDELAVVVGYAISDTFYAVSDSSYQLSLDY